MVGCQDTDAFVTAVEEVDLAAGVDRQGRNAIIVRADRRTPVASEAAGGIKVHRIPAREGMNRAVCGDNPDRKTAIVGDVDVTGRIDRQSPGVSELGRDGRAAIAIVPAVPVPANVEMMPLGEIFLTRLAPLSAK